MPTIDCESNPPDKPHANGTSDRVDLLTAFFRLNNINSFHSFIFLELSGSIIKSYHLCILNLVQGNILVGVF